VNQEFQKEIFLLNEQKTSHEKMMSNAFESFNSAQSKNAEMLVREKQNADRINRLMDEEKDKLFKSKAKEMSSIKYEREAQQQLSSQTIKLNISLIKLDYIEKKYEELIKSNHSTKFNLDYSNNRLNF